MNKLRLQWPERWGDEGRGDWGQGLQKGYGGVGVGIDGMVYAVYGLTEDEVKVIVGEKKNEYKN